MGKITATITRNYGDVSVTFALESDTTGTEDAHQKAMILSDAIGAMHAEYASTRLPKMDMSVPKGRGVSPDERRMEVTRLSKEVVGASVRVRCYGGVYSKWGVPIYEEVYKQLPIVADFVAGEAVDTYLEGKDMVIQMIDGKPKRVINIVDQS